MYVYVHWVLIQVVPFALLISIMAYFINDWIIFLIRLISST